MPSPSGSRDASPIRRDTREHNDDSTGQRPRTGVTDFERHVRQLAEQQQTNSLQNRDISPVTPDQQANSQETSDQREPLLPRKRIEVEKILETSTWQSPEVQGVLAQIRQEIPGTQDWDKKAVEVLTEYQEQMDKSNETRDIVAKLDTVSDMFKFKGLIYEDRLNDIKAKEA